MRFRPLTDGFITGLRFHKGPGNGGVHVANLWTASGTRIAQATFANETSSGWQTVSIPPTAVAAATTYVASVHMPQGHYSRDAQYFRDGGYEAWPLRALKDGEDGGNGLFRYGASGFPTSTSSAANYWIDVVFDVTNNVAPTVVGTVPSAGLQSVSRTSPVQATFSEGMNPSTLVFEVRTAGGTLVPGTTSYDGATRTASFTASGQLPALTQLTATVVSAKDASGASLAGPHAWSFTTIGLPGSTPTSLWDTSATPAGFLLDTPFELGVRFRADVAGEITALRFYRPPGSTGAQPGHLWNAAGTLLSTVVFPASSQPGWQQANLAAPVPVQKDAIYVASYHVPDGRFPATVGGLNAPVDRAPLHAPASSPQAGNGVYRSGASGFPSSTFEASNYWADVVFRVPPDTGAPVVVSSEPAANLIAVAIAAPVRATFDGPIAPASLVFTLSGPSGASVAGAVTYDAATATASFTPDERAGQRQDLHRLRSGDRHVGQRHGPAHHLVLHHGRDRRSHPRDPLGHLGGARHRGRRRHQRDRAGRGLPTGAQRLRDGRPLLQGRRQRRHPRRPPVDGRGSAPRQRDLRRRDGGRVAAGDVPHTDPGHRRHLVRGLVPRATGSLPVHTELLRERPGPPTAHGTQRRERAVRVRSRRLPDEPLRRHELLGRRDLRRHPGAEHRGTRLRPRVRSACRRVRSSRRPSANPWIPQPSSSSCATQVAACCRARSPTPPRRRR